MECMADRLAIFRGAVALLLACAIAFPATAQQAAAEPALPPFDIFEYVVEGNTRLSDIEIERAVTPFLGEGKTLREVEAARAALEAAYRNAGYLTVVVSIPEQKVDDGNVILGVLEGQVDRLRVTGADYHLVSGIKKNMPELAAGNVPYFPEVQRQLDALNSAADLKATPVLKAGRTPGTVDISLAVDDQLPLHGSIELNDRQSPGTKPLRLTAALRYDNLWQLGHSISLTAQTAPQASEQVKVLAGTYVMPLDRKGNSLALYAVHSSSNVPGPSLTNVLNNSDIVGLRLALPLQATSDYSHTLSLGLDHKNIHKLEMQAADGISLDTPAIVYVPLVATYNGAWLESGGSTALDSTVTLGVRGLFGGNLDADFNAKRPGASAQYFVLRAGVKQTETFKGWTASGRAEMQLASGLLLPNEQYAAGGADSVRGYQESEQTGDRAVRVSLELRTPGVNLGSATVPWRVTGVGFYDAARLMSLQYESPALYYPLRGIGLGLRLSGPNGLAFNLDLAKALTDGGTASINTKAGDYRVHSSLTWDY
jgi:hemolysin activation/secretion protein